MIEKSLHNQVIQESIQTIKDILENQDLAIDEETKALDIVEWDSLAHLEIITSLENRFKLRLKTSEIARLENFGSLLDIIFKRGNF